MILKVLIFLQCLKREKIINIRDLEVKDCNLGASMKIKNDKKIKLLRK